MASPLTVGILGGGQLGRMLIESANRLNIKTIILDVGDSGPAKQLAADSEHINGSFTSPESVLRLAERCDVITAEIEHVDSRTLKKVTELGISRVEPSWSTFMYIQDKYLQKDLLKRQKVRVLEDCLVSEASEEELKRVAGKVGYPFMLKSRTMAYDGRGKSFFLSSFFLTEIGGIDKLKFAKETIRFDLKRISQKPLKLLRTGRCMLKSGQTSKW